MLSRRRQIGGVWRAKHGTNPSYGSVSGRVCRENDITPIVEAVVRVFTPEA